MLSRRPIAAIVAVAVVGAGALAGALSGERSRPAGEQDVVARAGAIAAAVLEWLPEERQPDELIYDGIDGML